MAESGTPGEEAKSADLGRDNHLKENLIRIVTVFAYASSVSMAAMALSSYYIFFWEPKPPSPDPPVIHSHALQVMPPQRLMSSDGNEEASFWSGVLSYFDSKEKKTSLSSSTVADLTIKPDQTSTPITHTILTTDLEKQTYTVPDLQPNITSSNETLLDHQSDIPGTSVETHVPHVLINAIQEMISRSNVQNSTTSASPLVEIET